MVPTSIVWNNHTWVEVEACREGVFLTIDNIRFKLRALAGATEAKSLARLLLQAANEIEEKP